MFFGAFKVIMGMCVFFFLFHPLSFGAALIGVVVSATYVLQPFLFLQAPFWQITGLARPRWHHHQTIRRWAQLPPHSFSPVCDHRHRRPLSIVTCVQTWYYYSRYPHDMWYIKLLASRFSHLFPRFPFYLISKINCHSSLSWYAQVGAVLLSDTVHQILISHTSELIHDGICTAPRRLSDWNNLVSLHLPRYQLR